MDLEYGAWQVEPPEEVGAFSLAAWSATPGGLFGRRGIRGNVLYYCEWGGQDAILHVAFESPLFGERRVECREETVDGASVRKEDALLVVRTCPGEGGLKANCTVRVVIELRAQVGRHIALHQGPNSAATWGGLREGKLSQVLKQATRSCLIRIVNLTRHSLAKETRSKGAEGFWIAEPADCLEPYSFHDLGITCQGLNINTRGSLSYAVETATTSEEKRVRIVISWSSPWIGSRSLKAKDTSGLYVVTALSDRAHNLVGTVHIVDPQCLPALTIVDAVALARQSGTGADFTDIVVQQLKSPYELVVPSVRVLLGRIRRRPRGSDDRDDEYSEDWDADAESGNDSGSRATDCSAMGGMRCADNFSSLQVSYRIGPEVFRRTVLPNERLHLSSAWPGGDGRVETALGALEAAGTEATTAPQQELAAPERALLCQRRLASALSPVIWEALESEPGAPLQGLITPYHLWRTDGGRDIATLQDEDGELTSAAGLEGVELDLEGLMRVLRRRGRQIAQVIGVNLAENFFEEILVPVEKLAAAWAEQAEVDEGVVRKAVVAGAALLRAFGLEEAASEVDALKAKSQPRELEWLRGPKAVKRNEIARRSI